MLDVNQEKLRPGVLVHEVPTNTKCLLIWGLSNSDIINREFRNHEKRPRDQKKALLIPLFCFSILLPHPLLL